MTAVDQEEVNHMRDWQTVEIAGYHYYSNLGYRVFVSLVRTEHYDFVIEKGGRFKRVNVKLAFSKSYSNSSSWFISVSHTQTKKFLPLSFEERIKAIKKVLDIYLVWIPKTNRFIELLPGFELHMTTKYIRIPNGFLEDIPDLQAERSLHKLELTSLRAQGLKRCTLCGKIKLLEDFKKLTNRKNGWQPNCKACSNRYAKKWAKKNRDKVNTYRRNSLDKQKIRMELESNGITCA
ncbi:hypothetical protein ES703_70297 [subsurface metagenome]